MLAVGDDEQTWVSDGGNEAASGRKQRRQMMGAWERGRAIIRDDGGKAATVGLGRGPEAYRKCSGGYLESRPS